ncbi:ATP-binding protein [Pontibacter ruber]|uniref:histidine kinase n=1 Tax=Pontibacter ruber TaxID=1343895 RepID=A0ABW5CYK8_9BACT|nr:ATP-binding protein [Pontibacter ruber]
MIFKEKTKVKVVAGFGLALSVVAIAIYLTYASFTQLLTSVEQLSQPNRKLVKLHHTLSDIATAESSIRAYTLTTEDRYFKTYLKDLRKIECQIDTLRTMMKQNATELSRIDSISTLLQQKKQSMERYVSLKKKRKMEDYSDRAIRQIVSSATAQPAATIIKQYTNTTTTYPDKTQAKVKVAVPEEKSKRGLLDKLFTKRSEEPDTIELDVTLPPQEGVPLITMKQEVTVDTSKTPAPPVAQVSDVRNILRKLMREVTTYENMLKAKELALLQQDKQIMDRIRGMIYELEQYETLQASSSSVLARQVANKTSFILLLVGVFGLVSGIAFIFLILRDITRSNVYKAQLIRARKEAIGLARAKEAFVANMSHEIRTPLNVVLGFSEQLRHTPLQPQQQEHLQAISSAGEHLLHIVNDVLDLSKIEAGKLSIEAAPFSLQHVVTELEQAFTLKAQAKGIRFSCQLDEGLKQPLLGDALRLKQVLFNLVDNGIKFTHEGEVHVNCRLKSQRRGRVVVVIDVSDTGIGIPMEQTAHVFGEFNQADDSIIRKYGGTGLGLSISKQLVEMHNGSLTLRSTPGEGTTFSIILPLKKAVGTAVGAQAPIQTTAQDKALYGRNVLVIDDDAYSRTLCELILTRLGMHVYLANDGQEALQLIGEQHVDLVLTDIQLPGMSGKAVARAIRKLKPELPIIALTANIMSRNKRFFAKTGISDYLLKPYSEQELYQKLITYLPELPTPETAPAPAAVTAKASNDNLYDLAEMRQFAGSDSEAMAAILEVLIKDNRQNLQLLENAAADGDWQQAGMLAHRMQTAFRHLHAQHITPALSELEQLLHQHVADTSHLPGLVSGLSISIEEVLHALEQEVAAIRSTEEAIA